MRSGPPSAPGALMSTSSGTCDQSTCVPTVIAWLPRRTRRMSARNGGAANTRNGSIRWVAPRLLPSQMLPSTSSKNALADMSSHNRPSVRVARDQWPFSSMSRPWLLPSHSRPLRSWRRMNGITRATSGSSTARSASTPSACRRPCHSPVSRSEIHSSPSGAKSIRKKSWLGSAPRTCTRCQVPSARRLYSPSRVLAQSRPRGSRSTSPMNAAGTPASRVA